MCVLVCLSLCICVYMCAYVSLCVCVWGGTSGAMLGGYMHMCGCQRISLGVILRNTVYFFDIVSLLGLTGPRTPRIPLSLTLQIWDSKLATHIPPAVVATGLCSHACMSRASPDEPSFQPRDALLCNGKQCFLLLSSKIFSESRP